MTIWGGSRAWLAPAAAAYQPDSIDADQMYGSAHQRFFVVKWQTKYPSTFVRQNYSCHITIHPARPEFKMSKVFANATEEDARQLIESGRRATRPSIERIRNTTQISRTFSACLDRLAARYKYVKR